MKKEEIFTILILALAMSFFVLISIFLVRTQSKKNKYPELLQSCSGSILEGVCYEHTDGRLLKIIGYAIRDKDINLCNQIDFGNDDGVVLDEPRLNVEDCKAEYLRIPR